MSSEFIPTLFIIKISSECNLKCEYCYTRKNKGELSEETLAHIANLIVNWIKKNNLKRIKIGFLGGEPLLFTEKIEFFISQLYSLMNGKNDAISLSIQSNGTLLTKEKIRWIKKRKIIIGVSLDGPEEINDTARKFPDGSGSYKIIRNHIQDLIKANIEPRIITVIHKYNWNKVAEIINHFVNLGVRIFRFNPILPANKYAEEFSITPNQFFEAMKETYNTLETLKRQGIEVIEKTTRDFIFLLKGYITNMCLKDPCGAGLNMLVFNNDGWIYPCDMLIHEEFKMRPINETKDISELKRNSVLKKLIDRRRKIPKKCINCIFRSYCNGGCPARILSEKLNRYSISKWHCEFLQKYLVYLLLKLT